MKYFSLFLLFFLQIQTIFAVPSTGINPENGGWRGTAGNGWTLLELFAYIERIILQVVLPIGIVGVALYVGYQLVTASGDEEKMKKAFKSFTYSAVGLIATACAYAFVYTISRLAL